MISVPKVLIVDDKPSNLRVLEHTLSQLKVDLVQARSGNEALAASLEHKFALAILDVHMPNMDGYELAQTLRQDPNTRSLPIIFLSAAFTDSVHMFKGYEAGAVDYIVKPYEPRVLLSKVGVFLELDASKAELSRHRERLEDLVAVRTQALRDRNLRLQEEIRERKAAEQKLLATHNMLVHAAKFASVGELAAGVAHQLNQPLNALKLIAQSTRAEVSRGDYEPARLPDDCDQLVQLVDSMAVIVARLVNYAQSSEREATSRLDLNTVVTSAIDLASSMSAWGDISLDRRLAAELPPVRGDLIGLEQVFVELLTNARFAVQARCENDERCHGRITVSSFLLDDDEVGVDVQDTGVGVPSDIADQVFDPFFTTKSHGAGTGLGLSVAFRIVDNHHGRLELQPSEDGATFRVVLPRA
jgi:C4-dicarboxylate-specific signal transduction histidine kinase